MEPSEYRLEDGDGGRAGGEVHTYSETLHRRCSGSVRVAGKCNLKSVWLRWRGSGVRRHVWGRGRRRATLQRPAASRPAGRLTLMISEEEACTLQLLSSRSGRYDMTSTSLQISLFTYSQNISFSCERH